MSERGQWFWTLGGGKGGDKAHFINSTPEQTCTELSSLPSPAPPYLCYIPLLTVTSSWTALPPCLLAPDAPYPVTLVHIPSLPQYFC